MTRHETSFYCTHVDDLFAIELVHCEQNLSIPTVDRRDQLRHVPEIPHRYIPLRKDVLYITIVRVYTICENTVHLHPDPLL